MFVQSVAIPNGLRVERLRVDKGSEFISEEFAFRRGCRSSLPAPSRRSKSACPNALEELLQLLDACRQRTAKGSVGRIIVHGGVSVTISRAIECTTRPPGELWTVGTSTSLRYHRACSRHRWNQLRSRLICRAAAWTTITASQTTTFCGITLSCWNRSRRFC